MFGVVALAIWALTGNPGAPRATVPVTGASSPFPPSGHAPSSAPASVALTPPVPTSSAAPDPGGTQTPRPGTALPPLATPSIPKPADFDPTKPIWSGELMDEDANSHGIWSASIDGSGLTRWADTLDVEARLPDGAVWAESRLTRREVLRFTLHVGRIGLGETLIARNVWPIGTEYAAGAVYANLGGRGNAYWRFPLDGSAPGEVLPPSGRQEFTVVAAAVSRDGTAWARTFASGDLEMGGNEWFTQIGRGDAVWYEPFRRIQSFAPDGDLIYTEGASENRFRYDLTERRSTPADGEGWLISTPSDGYRIELFDHEVVVREQPADTPQRYPIPSFTVRAAWATDEALILEEQPEAQVEGFPTGVGRHLVMDLASGWYAVFDPIALPAGS
ncbi:MAG: hypothetical protein QOH61_2628 [Chloroflexota bacterium]|nr:hypothetical protein [Chloroflexota bacterium]